MLKIQLILLIIAITACSPAPIAQVNNLSKSPVMESAMPDKVMIAIKNVELLAREERYPPDGVPPQANRDIGFASVFLSLENPKEEKATLKINSIKICNASNGQLQAFSQPPQEIHLGPLENAKVAFHLTNKTGYAGKDKVKAVVTYEIGEQIKVIESEPVEIARY